MSPTLLSLMEGLNLRLNLRGRYGDGGSLHRLGSSDGRSGRQGESCPIFSASIITSISRFLECLRQ